MSDEARLSPGLFAEAQYRLVYPSLRYADADVLKFVIDDAEERNAYIAAQNAFFASKFVVDYTCKEIALNPNPPYECMESTSNFSYPQKKVLLDVSKVRLKLGFSSLEQVRAELDAGKIGMPLDIRSVQSLTKNRYLIPDSWNSRSLILFVGTSVRFLTNGQPQEEVFSPCLYVRDVRIGWRYGLHNAKYLSGSEFVATL